MIVQLLGTGSADGWPNPFCRCPSCTSERTAGRTRCTTAALVDGCLLLDAGPTAAAAAGRFGTSFADLEHILITHGHPDHLAPDFLLWRSWVDPGFTLHIWAPPVALERCRDWIGPNDAVQLHQITAGEELNLVTRTGDYAVRTLPAAHATGNGDVLAEEAVLFDITAPDARRLFYATDTGPFNAALLDQIRGRCFDLVLLDETFGTKFDHGHGHLDLETFPRAMQELRDMDAITEHSDVVAIHLSHHNPPTEQLRAQLLACCARVVDDGTVIEVGLRITGNSHHFILGGARSGKSHFAETIAARSSQVTYLATGYPAGEDPNWNARITAHRDRRPGHWRTEETIDLATAIEKAAAGSCLLIDCLALWLTRTLDEINGWSTDPQASAVAQKEIHRRTDQLVSALNNTRAEVILVSNEVGQGVVPETSSGRLFRDLLGVVNARVAQSCHEVTFMIAGRSVPLHDLTTVRG